MPIAGVCTHEVQTLTIPHSHSTISSRNCFADRPGWSKVTSLWSRSLLNGVFPGAWNLTRATVFFSHSTPASQIGLVHSPSLCPQVKGLSSRNLSPLSTADACTMGGGAIHLSVACHLLKLQARMYHRPVVTHRKLFVTKIEIQRHYDSVSLCSVTIKTFYSPMNPHRSLVHPATK